MIPIRTETSIKATPWVNYALIAANILAYFVLDYSHSQALTQLKDQHLVLHADWPRLYQFFTYQFLHASPMHLAGNMLFLWVFGNPVCAKMGSLPYLLFYVSGGVFAAWGYALDATGPMLGASGAIAAVTTAYLALFPRSRVTVLFFFFIITTFDVPAIILIVFKVILWDNIIMPGVEGGGNVAYSAHLAGYLFGFVATLLMLWWRALPRDSFDMVALWKRWHQRRAYAAALSTPEARARAERGTVARPILASPEVAAAENVRWDRVTDLRGRIADGVTGGDIGSATALYEQLIALDSAQCLPEKQQLQVARHFYETGRFPQAAGAFERFLASYPRSSDSDDVRLLLGIVYARDLRQYATAEQQLATALERIGQGNRREQCERWLRHVQAALGKNAPDQT
jgi:membrane associated rhomboid family serine protease